MTAVVARVLREPRPEWSRQLREIERELEAHAEAEVRRRWREEHGLIYVRTYTVQAYFRPRRAPRRSKR